MPHAAVLKLRLLCSPRLPCFFHNIHLSRTGNFVHPAFLVSFKRDTYLALATLFTPPSLCLSKETLISHWQLCSPRLPCVFQKRHLSRTGNFVHPAFLVSFKRDTYLALATLFTPPSLCLSKETLISHWQLCSPRLPSFFQKRHLSRTGNFVHPAFLVSFRRDTYLALATLFTPPSLFLSKETLISHWQLCSPRLPCFFQKRHLPRTGNFVHPAFLVSFRRDTYLALATLFTPPSLFLSEETLISHWQLCSPRLPCVFQKRHLSRTGNFVHPAFLVSFKRDTYLALATLFTPPSLFLSEETLISHWQLCSPRLPCFFQKRHLPRTGNFVHPAFLVSFRRDTYLALATLFTPPSLFLSEETLISHWQLCSPRLPCFFQKRHLSRTGNFVHPAFLVSFKRDTYLALATLFTPPSLFFSKETLTSHWQLCSPRLPCFFQKRHLPRTGNFVHPAFLVFFKRDTYLALGN